MTPTPKFEFPKFGFDVTAQPAMPPPPPQPRAESPMETMGLAKSADPRHNPGRGDHR